MGNEPDLKRDPAYGPYLNAAFLCEKVLEQKDGVLSVIRIVDRVTCAYPVSSEEPASRVPPFEGKFTFVIVLKSGQNPGTTNIKIVPKKPDNSQLRPLNQTIHLDTPDNKGGNLVIDVSVAINQEGVWWFEVFVNEVLRTKVPLQVIFLPQG